MRWLVIFGGSCVAMVAAVLAIIWAFEGFEGLGLSMHGVIALVIGVVVTTALGVVLMALVFHSDRSGRDDLAHHQDTSPGA
ncbi:hypothetical protein SH611_20980 [Geminicoccaceae bacterium 1502E]|nr:hypothetical protein [Geminicoccaceae bacterium 1502E]